MFHLFANCVFFSLLYIWHHRCPFIKGWFSCWTYCMDRRCLVLECKPAPRFPWVEDQSGVVIYRKFHPPTRSSFRQFYCPEANKNVTTSWWRGRVTAKNIARRFTWKNWRNVKRSPRSGRPGRWLEGRSYIPVFHNLYRIFTHAKKLGHDVCVFVHHFDTNTIVPLQKYFSQHLEIHAWLVIKTNRSSKRSWRNWLTKKWKMMASTCFSSRKKLRNSAEPKSVS